MDIISLCLTGLSSCLWMKICWQCMNCWTITVNLSSLIFPTSARTKTVLMTSTKQCRLSYIRQPD
nr:hypothetical protein Iba_chr09fCG3710 [Ipomoea batatas]